MKICLICNEYPEGPVGGVGTMNQVLARELVKLGHNVKVIGVYNMIDYKSPSYENDNGVEIYRTSIDIRNTYKLLKSWRIVHKTVKKWIKEKEIEIIEIPDSYAWYSVFRKLNVPFLIRNHGSNTFVNRVLNYPVKKSTKFLERKLIQKADVLCAVSRFTAGIIKDVFKVRKEIHIIYNGIDTQRINKLTLNSKLDFNCRTVVFSGSVERRKGVYQFINAAVQLLNQGRNLLFILNGKDTNNSDSGRSVKEELYEIIPLEFHQNFLFNGHQSFESLVQHYISCDVAVFPSLAETFGLAPIEAMQAGIPTIFSEYCAGPEIIDNWVDGVLIDPMKPDEIADAIAKLLDNKELANQIAKNGKLKVERLFSKEIMVEKTIELYEETIRKYKYDKKLS